MYLNYLKVDLGKTLFMSINEPRIIILFPHSLSHKYVLRSVPTMLRLFRIYFFPIFYLLNSPDLLQLSKCDLTMLPLELDRSKD